MSRRTPRRHNVRGHQRSNAPVVNPYERGQVYPTLPRRVVAPTMPIPPEGLEIPTGEILELQLLTEEAREGLALYKELEKIENIEEGLPVVEELLPEGEEPQGAIDFEQVARRLDLVNDYVYDNREKFDPETYFNIELLDYDDMLKFNDAYSLALAGAFSENIREVTKTVPVLKESIAKINKEYWEVR